MTTATLERQTYNLDEVAALLGVSIRHVYKLAQEDGLPGVVKCGSRWIMPRTKLWALLGEPVPGTEASGG